MIVTGTFNIHNHYHFLLVEMTAMKMKKILGLCYVVAICQVLTAAFTEARTDASTDVIMGVSTDAYTTDSFQMDSSTPDYATTSLPETPHPVDLWLIPVLLAPLILIAVIVWLCIRRTTGCNEGGHGHVNMSHGVPYSVSYAPRDRSVRRIPHTESSN